MVCSHSSLPPPFPAGVQGRELAPASGTWFRAPSAGAKDGTKGGLTVGAEALGPFSWPEGRQGEKARPLWPPLLPKALLAQPIQGTAGDPRHFLPRELPSLVGGGGRDPRAAGWGRGRGGLE